MDIIWPEPLICSQGTGNIDTNYFNITVLFGERGVLVVKYLDLRRNYYAPLY